MIDEDNDVNRAGEAGEDGDFDVFDVADRESLPDVAPRWTELPQSYALTIQAADDFLCWRDAAVIAIVGERNGGKTTLITEMYSCFLKGTFAEVLFCHSLSLMGFEKKCFQSRAESGGLHPETPRTSAQEGLSFFHLALANESDMKRHDLLISERAGEVYRQICDRPKLAAEMTELCKASSVVFIIDGERVANARKRPGAFASVRLLVRAMLNSGNVPLQARIHLVTTKFDLLAGDTLAEARESLFVFEQTISNLIAGKYEVFLFHTAARDPKPGALPAQGLEPLLRSWLQPSTPLSCNDIPLPVLTDEFDRLMLKRGNK